VKEQSTVDGRHQKLRTRMLDSHLNSTRTEKPTGVFTQLNRDLTVGLATVEHQQRTFLPRSFHLRQQRSVRGYEFPWMRLLPWVE